MGVVIGFPLMILPVSTGRTMRYLGTTFYPCINLKEWIVAIGHDCVSLVDTVILQLFPEPQRNTLWHQHRLLLVPMSRFPAISSTT
jgi:hypothetical protein